MKKVIILLTLTLSLSLFGCKETPKETNKAKRHVVNKGNNSETQSNSVAIPMHGVKENSSSHSNHSYNQKDSSTSK